MKAIDEQLKQKILSFFNEMCYFFDLEKAVRSGNVYVGRYGRADIPLPFLKNEIETVAGHSGGLAWMTFLFYVYFEDVRPGDLNAVLPMLLGMLFGLVHDMPEGQSEEGDQSDDRLRPEKVGLEENLMKQCLGLLPEDWRELLMTNHENAEGMRNELGRRRKGIDKLYAVIRSFKFDLDEHPGDSRFKDIGHQLGYFKEGMSRRDKFFAQVIGTYDATEVWAAHLLWTTQHFDDYDLYWSILHVVSEEVRGCHIWWLENDEVVKTILAYS